MSLYQHIHQTIQTWYGPHGRKELPWRQTDDPYLVYISEVMLQQTQVKTVLERYYFPFLEQFPTLTHLAEAQEQAVLKAWEGLGYYSRARNLHKAARQSAPALPAHYEGLLALPGIGQNTAHAILAFAFRKPVPVMEANVRRILYRFFAQKQATPQQLWELAFTLLDTAHPFEYNQAMMDIGAMVCTARSPPAMCVHWHRAVKEKTIRYPIPKKNNASQALYGHAVLWYGRIIRVTIIWKNAAVLFWVDSMDLCNMKPPGYRYFRR